MVRISGYPIIFDQASVDLGGFTETIAPQAIDSTLRWNTDVLALHNHNADHPLGRVSARTLRVRKDRRGLAIDLTIDPSIGFAADIVRVIERGDAIGGSFAFRALDDIWSLRDGRPHREVVDMTVSEVSVAVAFPAYPSTELTAVRSHAPQSGSLRDDMRLLTRLINQESERIKARSSNPAPR